MQLSREILGLQLIDKWQQSPISALQNFGRKFHLMARPSQKSETVIPLSIFSRFYSKSLWQNITL
jgi:hypothetical protein